MKLYSYIWIPSIIERRHVFLDTAMRIRAIFIDTIHYLSLSLCEMLVKFIFSNVLLSTTGCLGIVGNCCLIWLFMRTKARLNFHQLMIVLAIYDTILVVLCMMVFVLPELVESYKSEGFHYHIAPNAIAVIQISLTGSSYCTVGISI